MGGFRVTIFLLFVASINLPFLNAQTSKPYPCVYSNSPIEIDARAEDAVWNEASSVPSFRVPGSNTLAQAPTHVKLAWDLDYFYFFAEMEDSHIIATKTEHDAALWFEDVFEIFLRPSTKHQGYYEFQVSPKGTTLDIYWPHAENRSDLFTKHLKAHDFKFDVQTVMNDTGWQVEGRIRWRDLNMTGGRPAADERWTFALCRYDYHDPEKAELSSSAKLSEVNFHKREDYAEIQFVRPQPLQTPSVVKGSKVIGAPTPPPPFKAMRKYENIKLKSPIFLAIEPGTDDLLAITQDNPDGKSRLVRANRQTGEVTELLRMKDLAYNLCFHPNYKQNGQIFLGSNDAAGASSKSYVRRYTVQDGTISADSQKLIVQWPSNGHNGAAVAFGHDGMLYVTTGDGTTDSDTNLAGQQLDHLLAKLLRLDVDSADASQGYIVPPDNPFVDREDTAPETYAYGLRNPWRMATDAVTGQIWIGNNGQDLWEQVYLVEKGANWGWSVYEGSQPFYLERQLGPDPHTKPTFEHHHSEARSLTGGIVYHGKKYPELQGAYIYGDYSTGKIWAGKHNGKKVVWHKEIADSQMAIACFLEDNDGDILVLDYQNGGEINKLVPNDQHDYSKSFPKRISESGIFTDVRSYQLAEGAIPYDVNSPLWSDGTLKTRHIVLTNQEDRIGVTDVGAWNFPDYTVLVKSFAIELTEGDPSSRKFIETRFLTKQDNEWIGYSYRWNKSQTDAFLVADEGRDEDIRISTANGSRLQKWRYPSRSECMMCHARAAKYVLGLETVQLNKSFDYGSHIENQLSYLQRTGRLTINTAPQHAAFANQRTFLTSQNQPLATAAAERTKPDAQQRGHANDGLFAYGTEGTPKLAHLDDDDVPIATRARSYLYSNCAQCHVGAGGGNSQMHFEWTKSLAEMKIVGEQPLHGLKGIADGKLVVPGAPERSVLLQRMDKRGTGQMPNIATNSVHKQAVDAVRQWIKEMETNK